MRIYTKLLTGYLLISVLAAVLCYFSYIQLIELSDPLSSEIPLKIDALSHNYSMDRSAVFLHYYDEILEQSTRNYVFTQNMQWKQRYYAYKYELEYIRDQILETGAEAAGNIFLKAAAVSKNIVAIQDSAINMVDKGKVIKAVKLIESNEYISQRHHYKKELKKYFHLHGIHFEQAIEVSAVTVKIAAKQAKEIINKTIRQTVMLFALLIIISILIGCVLTKSIAVPINNLKAHVEKIRAGDFTQEIDISQKGEIGLLADSFRRMTLDLKKTRNELISAKEYIENIFRSMIDTLIVVTSEGVIITANQALLNLLGYKENELIGRHVSIILQDDSSLYKDLSIEQLTKNKTIHNLEQTYLAKDGREIPMLLSRSSLYDNNNVIQGVIFAAQDITGLKKSELAFNKTQKKLNFILENIPDFVITVDPDSNILMINRGVPGIAPEQAIGSKVYNYVEPSHREIMAKTIENVFKTGKPDKYEILGIGTKGTDTAWYETRVIPSMSSGQVIYVTLMSRDITERKSAEEQARSSQEKLRNLAAYLESVREEERIYIAREIHDELGQALTALKMDITWLITKLPVDQKKLLEKTRAINEVIASVIETVKKISTDLRPGILDDLGLAAAMEWYAEDFKNRTGINCDMTFYPQEIISDKDLRTGVYRIFQEALTNIARHSGATAVEIILKATHGILELKMSDNGKGITKEQIINHRSLGIIGMKERARSLHGNFDIQGSKGKGTILAVKIPLCRGDKI
ncbi:MAG: PAS domain S-box protein [bacterium]